MEDLALFDTELRPAHPAALPPATTSVSPAPDPRPDPLRSAGGRPSARAGPTLLAVDGNSLTHRAFHAYEQNGPGGRYGLLALLAAVSDAASPDAIVVGFDCRDGSVRRDRYPGYKAQRPPKPPALDALLDEAPGLLRGLGVAVVQPGGWEADDVCGSAATAAEDAGWRCVVATSDRDAFGLVSDRTTVLRLRQGIDNAVEMTPARLRREVGVRPDQYVEYAALCGDTSDNLSGVHGIGPRRARLLLDAFGTVVVAMADPLGLRSVVGRGPGQALLDDLADVGTSVFWRNVELMTIRRDVPVDVDACRRRVGPARIADQVTALGYPSLAGRMAVAVGARPDLPPPAPAPAR